MNKLSDDKLSDNNLTSELVENRSFFNARLILPNVLIKYSKNISSIAVFLPRILMYQKRQIPLPVGY